MASPVNHLDELLVLAGFGTEQDDSAGDHLLWHLVREAHTDDIAARIVLHRIFPSLVSMARRRGRIIEGGMNAAIIEVFAHAWMVIRSFPHERRTQKIASNIVRDTEYSAFVRQRRLRRVSETTVSGDVINTISDSRDTNELDIELVDVLDYAQEMGVNAEDLELLKLLGTGMHGDEVALAKGIAPRTVRNHRRHAIEAVQRALSEQSR